MVNIPPRFPDKGQADQFAQRNVCARCYSDLTVWPCEDRLWETSCLTCGEAWGYTTIRRSTAEKRGQAALAEITEVRDTLPDLFPNPNKGKSEKQLLDELGFGG